MNKGVFSYTPAWNALSLTLSGTALVSLLDPLAGVNYDDKLGQLLLWLATFILVVVALAWLRHAIKNNFIESLNSIGHAPLTGAIPASMLVLGAAWAQGGLLGIANRENATTLSYWLSVVGSILTVAFGTTFFSRIALSISTEISELNGTVFIPAVALVLAPGAFARIAVLGNDSSAIWVVWSAASLGAGLLLFIILGAVLAYRIIAFGPVPTAQIASWWIWLAPMGAGGLGVIATTRISASYFQQPSLGVLGLIIATAMWGFGLWWMIFAINIFISSRKEINFNLGFWGFGFPTAAYASLSLEIGRSWPLFQIEGFGSFLWGSLLVLVSDLVLSTINLHIKKTKEVA